MSDMKTVGDIVDKIVEINNVCEDLDLIGQSHALTQEDSVALHRAYDILQDYIYDLRCIQIINK